MPFRGLRARSTVATKDEIHNTSHPETNRDEVRAGASVVEWRNWGKAFQNRDRQGAAMAACAPRSLMVAF